MLIKIIFHVFPEYNFVHFVWRCWWWYTKVDATAHLILDIFIQLPLGPLEGSQVSRPPSCRQRSMLQIQKNTAT